MDAGSFMHACQLLLMRACVRRAYCKKCRVHIVLEIVGRSNVPVLILHVAGTARAAPLGKGLSNRPGKIYNNEKETVFLSWQGSFYKYTV